MDWRAISEFLHHHQEGLGLFAMSLAVTMRPKLPWPFCLIHALEWGYEWLRDALLTLLSLKGPLPHAAESQSVERITKTADGTVESVKESTTSGAAPSVPIKTENDPHHG